MNAMNPNQPKSGIDYLNSIAPQQQKAPLSRSLRPIHYVLGIGILLILLIVIGAIINGIAYGAKAPPQQLAARLATTARIVENSQAYIKSGKLRTLNSNLQLFLTDINGDIVAPLKTVGIETGKLDPNIVTQEAGTQLSGRLEDARLEARFDTRYAEEMAYKLGSTLELMEKIYNSTGSASLKAFLESAYKDLETTQKAFADFNNDKS